MWHGIAWLVFATACAHAAGGSGSNNGTGSSATGSGDACAVIEREQDVAACVGKTVTLRGVVSRTKIPAILGVDVAEASLGDKLAEATGVLETYTIPKEDETVTIHAASKGPGTYYALENPSGQGLATPRPVK